MKHCTRVESSLRHLALAAVIAASLTPFSAQAQFFAKKNEAPPLTIQPGTYGPYSAHILPGGRGLTKLLPEKEPILKASSPWTLTAWIEFAEPTTGSMLIAGAGDPLAADARYLGLVNGKPALELGGGRVLTAVKPLEGKGAHLLAASFDGNTARLYVDGAEAANGPLHAGPIKPELDFAPVEPSPASAVPINVPCASLPCSHFGGRIAHFMLYPEALTSQKLATLAKDQPDFRLIDFEEGSKPWALQVVQFAGNTAPQEPDSLPKRSAPFSAPKSEPLPPAHTTLEPAGAGDWILANGWKLAEAPKVSASGEQISTAGFNAGDWMAATVPGTVLTTMIARGIYPDPDFGLDNLDIPESLNKQDYWYRAEFATPEVKESPHFSLVLDGINYQAEVWVNGQHVGSMKGAFARGVFDVSKVLRADGKNALAVLISPAPHPGIPNEQSIVLGSGLNGGAMAIDGPTFMATEGWDWFPPMRDRNTGIWQDAHLVASGSVSIEDPQVITHLLLPDITKADLTINVPLNNVTDQPVHGTLAASFEGVGIRKEVTVAPGGSTVSLTPAEFSQLHLDHPRLWWPNGYGKPELYHLETSFESEGSATAKKKLQFGVREVSYEISLLDSSGALRRVEYDPALGRTEPQPQVNVTHEGMRQVPDGWSASITAGQDHSPVFQTIADTRATPYLIIKVNGLRIATRGGSWGMDDSRKRISREHLEPYFRYDRDANLNIIRNWQGQNTEEVFYELADKYGMMVWNDFWEVTTDSNAEAEDPQLFLRNAQDTILRYRNHPSIVIWCGRNEGVPQPIINKGLIALTHSLDGTRYFSPSSNQINLQKSGPYSYEDPADYYTKLDLGFAVEVGTPSLPTLEWFSRWIPKVDQWPISDDWAYHNWHPHDELNKHLEAQFGAADSLEDYERKAQMMNYVDYRAIFEGFNAHLWAPNGGRLLWMTQPAWPSTLWGILSSDYDTQASFYGTEKACEPVHVQLDLSNNDVAVVNTTRDALPGLKVSADVYGLDSKLLQHHEASVDAALDDVTPALKLDLAPLMGNSTVFVRLQLHAQDGRLLSDNFYWRAASDAGYRALDQLAPATLAMTSHLSQEGAEHRILVHLKNTSAVTALNTKLGTFYNDDQSEVLPAYYSDNYISLLPGQEKDVTIELPAEANDRKLHLKLRGWNVVKASANVM